MREEIENRIEEVQQKMSDLEFDFENCGYGSSELMEYESLREELHELEQKLDTLDEEGE